MFYSFFLLWSLLLCVTSVKKAVEKEREYYFWLFHVKVLFIICLNLLLLIIDFVGGKNAILVVINYLFKQYEENNERAIIGMVGGIYIWH